jgi:hypothetical protein
MSEARLLKFRFRPDGREKWLDWSEALKRRSEDLERAERAAQRSTFVIDREHAQVKSAALERVERLECLFFFDNR